MVWANAELPESGVRRIPQPIDDFLPPVRFFRDDIEQVFEILSSAADNVRLEVDDYLVADPSRIDQFNRAELRDLVFHASGIPKGGGDDGAKCTLSLRVYPSFTTLHAIPDDSLALQGLRNQILPIVERRRRRKPLEGFRTPSAIAWRLLFLALVYLILTLVDDLTTMILVAILTGTLLLFVELLLERIVESLRGRSSVLWRYSYDQHSWIREHGGEIAKYSVAAAVGSIVTVTLTLLLS